MADVFRLYRLAPFLGQIVGSEKNIPKGEFDAVIARVAIAFRNLGGMMPAVHLRRDQQIVQNPALDVGAAVRKDCAELSGGDGKNNRERIKSDDTQHKKDDDIAQREIDRVGNLS